MRKVLRLNLLICLMCLAGLSGASTYSKEMTISRALAEFAIDTESDKITSAAYEAAKKAVIDVIGVTLAGHNAPGVQPIVEQMRDWGGKTEAHIWVYGGKLPAPAEISNERIRQDKDVDELSMRVKSFGQSAILNRLQMFLNSYNCS